MNPINKGKKCFQYAVTVALNHEEIKKDLQKITKNLTLNINKYNWEAIDFHQKRWSERIDNSNVTIALNVLYAKKEKTYPASLSKHDYKREKQVILLMIPNEEKWQILNV